MQGWTKPKGGAEYANVTLKTFRGWLSEGLKHSRLPSNRILVKYTDIDTFLERYSVTESRVSKIVNSIMEGF